jgi:hypothetical protein
MILSVDFSKGTFLARTKFKMMSCEMILNTPNAENIGISSAELWGVENPDTLRIDTSRIRQTISADTTPKTVQ